MKKLYILFICISTLAILSSCKSNKAEIIQTTSTEEQTTVLETISEVTSITTTKSVETSSTVNTEATMLTTVETTTSPSSAQKLISIDDTEILTIDTESITTIDFNGEFCDSETDIYTLINIKLETDEDITEFCSNLMNLPVSKYDVSDIYINPTSDGLSASLFSNEEKVFEIFYSGGELMINEYNVNKSYYFTVDNADMIDFANKINNLDD